MSVSNPLIRNYLNHIYNKSSKKEVDLPHFTIPLLGKMAQVSKEWRTLATSDHTWQAIGDSLGMTFSTHAPLPRRIRHERPKQIGKDNLLYKSILHLHKQIYPSISQTYIQDYFCNHLSLPAPSKMEQVIDLYAETTVKAYYGVSDHPEIKKLLGSLEIKDIRLLRQINEARDCFAFWVNLAWKIEVELPIKTTSLEALLAVPEELLKWCATQEMALRQIKSLDFQLCHFSYIPDVFGYLPNLESLEFRINDLKQLPDSIGTCTKLHYLGLVGNQLTQLPDSMKNLKELNRLILNENDLSELPYWIGELKNLYELNINHNHLTYLPSSLVDLTKLGTLDLEGNKLVKLPVNWEKFKKLNYCNLSSNAIEILPTSFGELDNLETLLLDGNKLTIQSLPPKFWSLPKMNTLTVENSYACNFWDHKMKLRENRLRAAFNSRGS